MASILFPSGGGLWERSIRLAISLPSSSSRRFNSHGVLCRRRVEDCRAGQRSPPEASSNWPKRLLVTPPRSIACCELLAAFGVFAEDAAGKFHITDLRPPRWPTPGSLRQWILFEGTERAMAGLCPLARGRQDRRARFRAGHGQDVLPMHRRAAFIRPGILWSTGHLGRSKCQAILNAYDFGRFQTVVDVGGGEGRLISHLLRAYPQLRHRLRSGENDRQSSRSTCRHAIGRAPRVRRGQLLRRGS